jgi:hypothetical protein
VYTYGGEKDHLAPGLYGEGIYIATWFPDNTKFKNTQKKQFFRDVFLASMGNDPKMHN